MEIECRRNLKYTMGYFKEEITVGFLGLLAYFQFRLVREKLVVKFDFLTLCLKALARPRRRFAVSFPPGRRRLEAGRAS